MINITKKGKFAIPENECFIGYAGDNLNETKEIFVEEIADMSLVYRMYLMFDDGSCNYFLLDSQVQSGGTLLTWNITNDQIFKSGVVQVQIKASNDSGEVFHSSITTMLVQTSVEFSDYFCEKDNSEFLRHEQVLNDLKSQIDATNAAVNTALENVNNALATAQDVLGRIEGATIDSEPVRNSQHLVTSGGVYNALGKKFNYKDCSTISDPSELDSMKELDCVYDVTITSGVVEGVNSIVTGKIFNVLNFQYFFVQDGRIFSRDVYTGGEFIQIGFTKDELVQIIKNEIA